MSTANESVTQDSPIPTLAMYKGLKVAIYLVDKLEIILTRQDLIEVVNVCTDFCIVNQATRSTMHVH